MTNPKWGYSGILASAALAVSLPFLMSSTAYAACAVGAAASSLECDNGSATAVTYGGNATAVGESALADSESTAVGSGAQAHNGTNTATKSTAVGNDATANFQEATAVGEFATAGANQATALGQGSTADGVYSTAVGVSAAAGTAAGATAVGANAVATGLYATALGAGTDALDSARATGARSVAVGNLSEATMANASAFGYDSHADGMNSSAIGYNTNAVFDGSTAVGSGATTTRVNQMVFGTTDNTYTAPGITSDAGRAAQTGPLELVTTDAAGNLASDQGSTFAEIEKNREGVAIAMALENPDLKGDEHFGLAVNWGVFEGVHAVGGALMGSILEGDNGGRLAISGGIGVGLKSVPTGGNFTDFTYGARAGAQFTW